MGKMEGWSERRAQVEPILEKKRFSLSSENFSKERLRILKREFEEFQAEHPEVISFSIFGSMSKGYAESESDIDGWLFVSATGKDTGQLLERFKKRLEERLPDVKLSFLLESISKEEFNNLLDDMAQKYEGARRHAAHVSLEEAIPYFSYKAERIGNIFMGISLGRGLDAYRASILYKLKSMGRLGEEIWKEIVKRVRVFERFPRESDSQVAKMQKGKYENLYPQNLDEAMGRYIKITAETPNERGRV